MAMWNKKPEPEPSKPQAVRTPAFEPIRQPAAPPAAAPVQPAPVARPAANAASIGSSMVIKGDIHSREELLIDGEVEGTVDLQDRLTVGPNGKIKANVKAREVIVFGSIRGNVEVTEKIAIRDKGNLVGDIRAAGIVIDDGAYFKGSIDIVRPVPEKKPAAAPAPKPEPVQA